MSFEGLIGDSEVLVATAKVLAAVRKAKSDAKASMKVDVERVAVISSVEEANLIKAASLDLAEATRAAEIVYSEGEFSVESVLSDSSS